MSFSEDDLRNALQRKQPRDGFAARVLARLDEAPPAPRVPWYAWRAALALLCLLVFAAAAWRYQQIRRERLQAEAARDQLMLALELTAGKLKSARARIVHLSYENRPANSGPERNVE
jgi:hypothetical protein